MYKSHKLFLFSRDLFFRNSANARTRARTRAHAHARMHRRLKVRHPVRNRPSPGDSHRLTITHKSLDQSGQTMKVCLALLWTGVTSNTGYKGLMGFAFLQLCDSGPLCVLCLTSRLQSGCQLCSLMSCNIMGGQGHDSVMSNVEEHKVRL